eukprot:jgi/Psemu1/49167/gm1.49167_g
MSNVPIGGRTRSKMTGRFLSLQPGSAANRAPLTPPPTIMAPNQQDNPNQDNEEDVPILDLFPSFDQPLATFLRDSFDATKESNSTLCEALIASQYKTWLDFLYIENIGDLAYLERGTRTPLFRHVQLNLQRDWTEYARLPHVVMTSDKYWNPSVLDGAYTPHDDTFIQKYPPNVTLLPYQDYDEFGTPRGTDHATSSLINSFMSSHVDSPVLQALDTHDTSFWISPADYIHQEVLSRCSILSPFNYLTAAPHTHSPTDMDYLSLKPFFGWISTDRIKATFDNSTQYGLLFFAFGLNQLNSQFQKGN